MSYLGLSADDGLGSAGLSCRVVLATFPGFGLLGLGSSSCVDFVLLMLGGMGSAVLLRLVRSGSNCPLDCQCLGRLGSGGPRWIGLSLVVTDILT